MNGEPGWNFWAGLVRLSAAGGTAAASKPASAKTLRTGVFRGVSMTAPDKAVQPLVAARRTAHFSTAVSIPAAQDAAGEQIAVHNAPVSVGRIGPQDDQADILELQMAILEPDDHHVAPLC